MPSIAALPPRRWVQGLGSAVGGPTRAHWPASHPPDLLYGTAKAGKYQYDKVLNVSSKTEDGVVRRGGGSGCRRGGRGRVGHGASRPPAGSPRPRRCAPGAGNDPDRPQAAVNAVGFAAARRAARRQRHGRAAGPVCAPCPPKRCPHAPTCLQEFTVNAVGKDDKLEMALKGAYAANKYSVTATLAQSGKVRRGSLAG